MVFADKKTQKFFLKLLSLRRLKISLGVFIPEPNEKVNSLLVFPLILHLSSLVLWLMSTSKHVFCSMLKLKAFRRMSLAIEDNMPGSFDKLDFSKNIACITVVSTLFGV